MGMLMLIITASGIASAIVLLIVAVLTDKTWLARFTLGAAAIWVLFYAVALAGTSLVSTERTLQVGDVGGKAFCGFYIDCHMHAAVAGVRTAETIGDRTADGQFYIVNLTVYSDARNPDIPFRLLEPRAQVIDDEGHRYYRLEAAERLLPSGSVSLGQEIHGRETIAKEIVFDIPADARHPRLDLAEGYGIDRVLESLLIGDEDSFLHARTYFELPEQSPLAGVK